MNIVHLHYINYNPTQVTKKRRGRRSKRVEVRLTVASMMAFSLMMPQNPKKEVKKMRHPPTRMKYTATAYKLLPMMVVMKFRSTASHIPIASNNRPRNYGRNGKG